AGSRAATEASFSIDRAGEGWPARLLYGPAARLMVGLVLDRNLESRWLRWGGIVAAGLGVPAVLRSWLRWGGIVAAVLAVPAMLRGWLLAGLVLLVAGALLDATGRLLAALRLS